MRNQNSNEEIEQTEREQKKIVRYPFWDFILEIIEFIIMCFVIAGIMFVIFVLIIGWVEVFNNLSTIATIMFQPSLLGAFFLWVSITKRKKFKDILMGKPKIPEKGHRWFYYFFIITWFILLAGFFTLLLLGWILFEPNLPEFWLDIYSGVLLAPIVEEIVYRGYIYLRCDDIYQGGRIYYEWKSKKYDEDGKLVERTFMTFEITYAAVLSSVLFSVSHVQYMLSGFTAPFLFIEGLIGGLLFCKFRNETDSLITGMVFHGMYNFGVQLIGSTVFLFLLINPALH